MIGVYRGVHWSFVRICDVMAQTAKRKAYFVRDSSGKYSGDHFATRAALERWIDVSQDTAESVYYRNNLR